MAIGFDEVPLNVYGEPMLVARDVEEYWRYLDWLVDYLHRPDEYPGTPLSYKVAQGELISIEIDIASAIWEDPFEDYPPPYLLSYGSPRHADYLHREEIARVLSRVADRAERLNLLHRFYTELNFDSSK